MMYIEMKRLFCFSPIDNVSSKAFEDRLQLQAMQHTQENYMIRYCVIRHERGKNVE